ncbi:YdhR family protein [Hartmannibacter diazotrophicus]|uniref:YdhR family protein n=1 Tax=Hartmannibacter diazotrophicus TaxID=1482074 RepID=UPI0012FE5CA1
MRSHTYIVAKIWGLDETTGEGTSVYLFRDADLAKAFACGPQIEALRSGPATDVAIRLAPIEEDLSRITHAAPALAAPASPTASS